MRSRNFLLAIALGAALPALAHAQSDFNFPTGAGAAVTSSVANFAPSGATMAAARGLFIAGLATTVSSPRGPVTVSANTARAVNAVMGGDGANSPQGQMLAAALGGGAQAIALTNALAAAGTSHSLQTVSAAIAAYNALVAAIPAGTTPNEAVAAVRAALQAMSGN